MQTEDHRQSRFLKEDKEYDGRKIAQIEAMLKESKVKLPEKMKVDHETQLKEAKEELEQQINANF